jgi:hypothetical protein
MKMVKSAFLASAAGLVAMSGAQAADLPVKAKPVEYVKVCSLYGAGFYYIPGTDICMKIGGYVRFQQSVGTSNSISFGPVAASNGFNREFSDYQYRVRAIASFDTRQQTAYGTLRTYLILGFTQDSVENTANPGAAALGSTLYATRAFIQIAGFTFGKATSFFDFVSTAAVAYNAGHTYTPDTGDAGHVVAAYTAQFGNGMSATLSVESDRRRAFDYLGSAIAGGGGGAVGGADLAGNHALQDIVANIRVDQAWGSAQIAGAVRPMTGSYYGAGNQLGTIVEWNGHPGNDIGWAATAGIRLNAPRSDLATTSRRRSTTRKARRGIRRTHRPARCCRRARRSRTSSTTMAGSPARPRTLVSLSAPRRGASSRPTSTSGPRRCARRSTARTSTSRGRIASTPRCAPPACSAAARRRRLAGLRAAISTATSGSSARARSGTSLRTSTSVLTSSITR